VLLLGCPPNPPDEAGAPPKPVDGAAPNPLAAGVVCPPKPPNPTGAGEGAPNAIIYIRYIFIFSSSSL
jgi:hypothetical protein